MFFVHQHETNNQNSRQLLKLREEKKFSFRYSELEVHWSLTVRLFIPLGSCHRNIVVPPEAQMLQLAVERMEATCQNTCFKYLLSLLSFLSKVEPNVFGVY